MSVSPLGGYRAGVALLAVLIVVTIGALVGTSLLYAADAGRESAAASLRIEQSRLLAWSGVQAVMSELAAQRDELLAGEAPRVTSTWIFDEVGGGAGEPLGPRYAYRLIAVGASEIISEPAKLDVNHATAEMLAKVPALGEPLAAKIVAARPFASLHELTRVEGITESMLFGAGGEVGHAAAPEQGLFGDSDPEGEPSDSLSRVLTVFSFDPNVQTGLGDRGASSAGDRRLNLNAEWSEDLGQAVERRLGPEAAAALKGAMTSDTTFARDGEIVKQLRSLGVPAEDWAEILDVFTTTDAEYVLGRVDLLTAPADVLACIPGIDEESAARIVERRGKIEPELRKSVTWPVVDGVLTPEQFTDAVDHLTVRAMQWRVIIEAGTVASESSRGQQDDGLPPIGGPSSSAGAWPGDDGAGSPGDLPEGRVLDDRIVLEAVIDVSARRPRVAYLRDITMLPLAAVMRQRARAADKRWEAPTDIHDDDVGSESTIGSLLTDEDPPTSAGDDTPWASDAPTPSEAAQAPITPVPPGSPPTKDPAADGPTDGRIGRWTTRSGDRR